MSDTLERDDVIGLLDRLGSEQDEDVLAAARALHAQITQAGMSWQDLLVGDEPAAPDEPAIDEPMDEADDDDDDDAGDAGDAPEPATKFDVNESETRALIDKLLAREGNSEEFREELEEYKTDLANGDFSPSDHRYVQALYTRLTKKA